MKKINQISLTILLSIVTFFIQTPLFQGYVCYELEIGNDKCPWPFFIYTLFQSLAMFIFLTAILSGFFIETDRRRKTIFIICLFLFFILNAAGIALNFYLGQFK